MDIKGELSFDIRYITIPYFNLRKIKVVKRYLHYFSFILCGFILIGCTEESPKNQTSMSKEGLEEKSLVEKDKISISITYFETTLDDEKTNSNEVFESKSMSYFNGCHNYTLEKFQILGSGKDLDLVIKSKEGKVLLQKDKISVETSLDLSSNEVKDIGKFLFFDANISIKQNGKELFAYSTTTTGCH